MKTIAPMTVGGLRDRLAALVETSPYTEVKDVTADFYSSRSYYAHVAINPTRGAKTRARVLLDALDAFISEGMMEGYKGGEFDIRPECLIFVEAYGMAFGPLLCDIADDGEITVCEQGVLG